MTTKTIFNCSTPYKKVIYCDATVKSTDNIKALDCLNISKKVKSIQECAESLQKTSETEGKCNFVMICGHGAPGQQGLGSNLNGDYTLGKDFQCGKLGDIEREIQMIGQALKTTETVKPVLFLSGCEVGKGDKGITLILELSKLLKDVIIVAAEDQITFVPKKKHNFSSVSVNKLSKGKAVANPIEFKFACNGRLIRDDEKLCKVAGISIREDLLGELQELNNA
ncbi:MAG: DUF4347 domain-containing protein [Verrucomicrobia bacterium]|nr:DUF4347 domain-containing protein [Verrucomicrobiota bacterium]